MCNFILILQLLFSIFGEKIEHYFEFDYPTQRQYSHNIILLYLLCRFFDCCQNLVLKINYCSGKLNWKWYMNKNTSNETRFSNQSQNTWHIRLRFFYQKDIFPYKHNQREVHKLKLIRRCFRNICFDFKLFQAIQEFLTCRIFPINNEMTSKIMNIIILKVNCDKAVI